MAGAVDGVDGMDRSWACSRLVRAKAQIGNDRFIDRFIAIPFVASI